MKISAELQENPYCSIMSYPSMPNNFFLKDSKADKVNPYQKPLALYLRLLKMFALPGSIVIDVTLGTGALEVAALEKSAPDGLHFYSFDINEYQLENAKARLDQVCLLPTSRNNVPCDVEAENQAAAKK